MEIKVCIGSSCHLRGSYDVIEKLKALIAENNLSEKVVLKASFCLGRCGTGVTVVSDGDDFWENATPDTIEQLFSEKVLARI